MKRIFSLLPAFIGIFLILSAATPSKLEKTEILGKEYYVYEAKKGESIYGVAKRYGWDLEEVLRLNPEVSGGLNKGMKIYYPTGQVTKVTEMPQPVELDPSSLEPIRHKVKKGETIYSISRQYNIPLEVIYRYNPESKYGVKAGEIIEMPQTVNAQFYYYTVKSDDTLSAVSRKFNTTVEDILRNNPGVTIDNLKPGDMLRISINSNAGRLKTELVTEEEITSISTYKVNKEETWEEISEKTGVETEVLKEANNGDETPSDKNYVTVPTVEEIQVEKTIVPDLQEDLSEIEVRELYDSIKGTSNHDFEGVRMALILDEPSSKKDIDFTRGILVALSQMKNAPYKIDLKVLDGRVSTGDLTDELDDYEPNLIVSTADKAFPLFLADYGNTNNIQIVNAFDLKNDLFEDNASMVQILPPSHFYNDRISTQIYKDNRTRKLIFVGDEDENDGVATELKKLFENENESISLEEFGALEPDVLQPVVIYSYAHKKEEVSDFLKNVESIVENYPGFLYKIVGRSSWIAMLDDYGDQFSQYSVVIPSRVWLDEDSKDWKRFQEEYDDLFGGYPMRSIPNFAASGYDIAEYFIPLVAENYGDFNKITELETYKPMQNDIKLRRVNNWGGFINDAMYLIKFSPNSDVERVIVK